MTRPPGGKTGGGDAAPGTVEDDDVAPFTGGIGRVVRVDDAEACTGRAGAVQEEGGGKPGGRSTEAGLDPGKSVRGREEKVWTEVRTPRSTAPIGAVVSAAIRSRVAAADSVDKALSGEGTVESFRGLIAKEGRNIWPMGGGEKSSMQADKSDA